MKPSEIDKTTIREFRSLAAFLREQSRPRLHIDTVSAKDNANLRAWEQRLQAQEEMKRI